MKANPHPVPLKTAQIEFGAISMLRRPGNWRGEMVGVRGFEPPAPASRTQCSTRLSYTPTLARNGVAPAQGPAIYRPTPSRASGVLNAIGRRASGAWRVCLEGVRGLLDRPVDPSPCPSPLAGEGWGEGSKILST